jgi:hypothetical protein
MNDNIKKINDQKKYLLFWLFLFVISNMNSFGQENLPHNYYLPKSFKKTLLWIRADEYRNKSSDNADDKAVNVIINGRIARELKLNDWLDIIKRQSDLLTFLHIKDLVISNYDTVFPYLINFLVDSTTVGIDNVTNINDISNSELQSLSTIAGRASFILNELTGENFCAIQRNSVNSELKRCQELWIAWIKRLKKA